MGHCQEQQQPGSLGKRGPIQKQTHSEAMYVKGENGRLCSGLTKVSSDLSLNDQIFPWFATPAMGKSSSWCPVLCPPRQEKLSLREVEAQVKASFTCRIENPAWILPLRTGFAHPGSTHCANSIKGMWGFGVSPFPQTKEPFSLWWVEGTSTERPSRCAGMLKQMSNISSGGERGTVPALKSALAFSSAAPFSSDPPPPRASRRRRHFWVKLLRFAVLPPSEESPQVQLRRLHLHRYSGYITKGWQIRFISRKSSSCQPPMTKGSNSKHLFL